MLICLYISFSSRISVVYPTDISIESNYISNLLFVYQIKQNNLFNHIQQDSQLGPMLISFCLFYFFIIW